MAEKEGALPIGSVVELKGGNTKLMILGYLKYGPLNKTDIFDYVGCVYPEGYFSPEKSYVFNHTDIMKIYALGYQEEHQEKFSKQLMTQFEKFKGIDHFEW